jgi:hypothetical protein
MKMIATLPLIFILFLSCKEDEIKESGSPSFEMTSAVVVSTPTTNTFTGLPGDEISLEITGKTPAGFGSLDFDRYEKMDGASISSSLDVDYNSLHVSNNQLTMNFKHTLAAEFFNVSPGATMYLRIRLNDTQGKFTTKLIRIVKK